MLEALKGERDSDELWTQPAGPQAQEPKATIVVASAVTQPGAASIETEQRTNHEIESARVERATGPRFVDAERIAPQRYRRLPSDKAQRPASQDRDVDAPTAAASGRHEAAEIGFTIEWKIKGKAICPRETGELAEPIRDRAFGRVSLGGTQRSSQPTDAPSCQAARVLVRRIEARARSLAEISIYKGALPACAVADRCSRTGATGGVSRGSCRLPGLTGFAQRYRQDKTPTS
jgi:hypothetical protein